MSSLASSAGDVLADFTDGFHAFVSATEISLWQVVPAFLMPSLFMPLARIPRTGTGKIDRRSIRHAFLSLPAGALDPIRRRKAPKAEPATPAEDLGRAGVDTPRQHGSSFAQGPVRQLEPFSLSRVDADPKSFSDLVCREGILPCRVLDALSATEVQEFFIQRNTVRYYNFRLRGTIDVDRLRAACDEMMTRFSILRTVFLDRHVATSRSSYEGFPCHSCITPLARISSPKPKLCGKTIDPVLILLVYPGIRFRQGPSVYGSHLACAVGRRVHAAPLPGSGCRVQWRRLVTTSGFSDVLYQRAVQRGEAGFSFWREYLDGAVMARTALPSLPAGFTMATLVIAACGFHLARLMSCTDVTFGQTVNGRSMPLENIDVILGPCLNFIPLRLRLQRAWTVRDLLQHVQDQYVRPLQYDYMGLRDIVRHSTDWPAGTEFGLIVQHQNIQLQHDLPLEGDVQVEYSLFPQFNPVREVFVFSEPHETHLEMQICANSRILSPDAGTALVKSLCEIIELFADNPDMRLAKEMDSVSV
ncbi:uncharacterized protein CDV56_101851 [Aspergillus thermomutatus]|uniref:Condensation domain-containing protein n=1 Tax=Aspergillus thermomutatus TaxID=41047 RepID=A0A397HET6_ASPTH|nr:uncharacterized protein CDV56_101851 [Aspergillus thermomutatus]RHZ58920.1 hypothetical protein CDV56_101851 [Aspergillus thermomutatus]